jgi:very-short-patch-repair endonuclease
MPLSRIALARYLRRTMSGVEWNLWSYLRARGLGGYKFRRKALVGPYIVDFACLSARLVVEIGGELYDGRWFGDDVRSAWLESRGFRVVRFADRDVAEHLEQVLDTIRSELAARPQFTRPYTRLTGEISRAAIERGSFRGRRFRPRRPGPRGP